MSDKVSLITNDGLGGCLLAAQAAFFVHQAGKQPLILCPARDEVFKPLKHILNGQFEVQKVPEILPDNLIIHGKLKCGFAEEDEVYLVYPDGLYRNPYAFDYKKYNTNPQTIKSTRVLTRKFKPEGKQIYVGLITSTPGYLYSNIPQLLDLLGRRFPDYIIHCPIISTWAGINLDIDSFGLGLGHLTNVEIYNNPDFIEQLDLIAKCEYGIYTDNGVSHVSYHLGQNRLLIDPRYGFNSNLPWTARWRQTFDDSIRFDTLPKDIVDLVELNLKIPQTTLLPKQFVLVNKQADWSKELLFKF